MSATEQKHTPGPWEWDGRVWQYDEQEEAPWLVQAPWHDIKSKAVLSGSIRCNTEANARLIAAAPELLAALKGLLGITDFHELFGSKTEAARAAIAKATGAPHE